MDNRNPYVFKIKIPSDLDYIAPVRKFVAETLEIDKFSPKFAYRSEFIVDEICYNAIVHGSRTIDACVELVCTIFPDRFELQVNDQGGKKDDLERLQNAVKNPGSVASKLTKEKNTRGLGLELVRLLSEEITMEVGQNSVTTVRVVRKREDV
jgi:anti-sigma regulatory factor (Ser/Thr protein kinase)